jgi:A/G-specific adenine glycosylase
MKAIHQKLYSWYSRHGRHDLPWRNSNDPYHIYLSEVMLQQTQVQTVLERYYFPFLEKFPTLQALAEASLDEVLKMWEGLGYYTRAGNLHKTAQLTAPSLPDSYEALLALPGIGKNTASAICAFAYRQKRAVMEANVRRVLCRIYALDEPKETELIEKAHALLDEAHPFDYNQAMMDLGAMVCTPRDPACDVCAFAPICRACALECYDFPVKKRRSVPLRKEIVVVQICEEKIALKQRSGRFLHGLWGFAASQEARGEYVGRVRHQYTHFKLENEVYVAFGNEVSSQMFTLDEIRTLALSTVDRKILQLLERAGFTSRL